MHIFFDTGFTQFRDGELLSIGLVTDTDQTLVVEIHDPARHGRANDFCKQNVLPQFGATAVIAVADDAAAGSAVADWIAQFPTRSNCALTTSWIGGTWRPRSEQPAGGTH